MSTNFDPTCSDLASLDPAVVRAWRDAALIAWNDLATGGKVVRATYVQGDGTKSVEYTPANADILRAWLAKLNAQLGIGRRGPMRPFF